MSSELLIGSDIYALTHQQSKLNIQWESFAWQKRNSNKNKTLCIFLDNFVLHILFLC